jgi:hypothetical protein
MTRGEEPKYLGEGGDCPSTTLSTAIHPQISLQTKGLSYGYGFCSKRAQWERRPGTGPPSLQAKDPAPRSKYVSKYSDTYE